MMSNDVSIKHTRQTTGRALYIGQGGELYVARTYRIYRSIDWGATWQLDCFVPASGWKPLVAKTRLGARLLRYDIAAFRVLDDGSRVALARDGVYRAGPDEIRMSRVFRVTRGSRPLNLALDGARVLFGEYGSGLESCRVRVYVSEDRGKSFHVGFQFPKGDIRHIHNVLVDPYQDNYWILTGDFDHQAGIAALSKDMQTLEWLKRGSQKCRAAGALVERDRLIYGTDSDRERNFIVSIEKQSGELNEILEVEGSSLYATTFGPLSVISTCVEPNPACTSRECSLYASTDGARWQRVIAHRKDRHHPHYFQVGLLVLPYAYNGEARGMYSGQAVEDMDGKVSLIEFSLAGES
ncbi:MAG: hypothetical protein ACYSWU_07595 [Planctomycetota bacterium]|jgi:hypothetical protein